MNYRVKLAHKAEKAIKKLKHSGTFNLAVLNTALKCLEQGKSLPERFKDHQLHGEFAQVRECHLGFNLLLLYKRNDETQIITIANIGTHPELFGE
jgi:mRNA interferase YafQ